MVDRHALLKPSQVAVLQWIADGCPDGVMQGHSYKTTAVALQDRRLVTISRKGGTWRATLTQGGGYYLQHGAYPANPRGASVTTRPQPGGRPRTNPAATPAAQQQTAVSPSSDPSTATPAGRRSTSTPPVADLSFASPPSPRPPRRLPASEQLVADVIAAGGELAVNRSQSNTNYEALVRTAIRFGKVPAGKQLVVVRGRRWEELSIRLEDPPAWLEEHLEPIPVPEALRKPHPVVAALRTKESFDIKGDARQRALRLLQALAGEAERRGYRVTTAQQEPNQQGYGRGSRPDHLTVAIQGHDVSLRVDQQFDRVPHVATAAELRRVERESWFRIPEHDDKPSLRLSISVSGIHEHRQSRWNDTENHALEQRLNQILQEVELRAAASERDRLEREEEARLKRRRWEAAVDQARSQLVEHHRGEELRSQVTRWQEADAIRRYCQALERHAGDREHEVGEWVVWARRDADEIDPTRCPPGMPADPEATPDALRPFLRGWSPYGPDAWG